MTEDTASVAPAERMAIAMSRRLEDGWLGIVGAASLVPIGAVLLARELHAPNLKWICSGTGAVSPTPPELYPSSTQYEYLWGATTVLRYDEIALLFERGLDYGFFGGIEIDGTGAANTVVTSSGAMGPGPAGLPLGMARTSNVLLYSGRHDTKTLVPQVQHRTGVNQGNVNRLTTPRAQFAFGSDGPTLTAILDGSQEDEIARDTGFEFTVDDPTPRIEATKEELATLRRLDRRERLRDQG